MKKLCLLALVFSCSTLSSAASDSYTPQASFPLAGSTVIGMDQDAAGNLYVLALAAGAVIVPGNPSPYTVTSYQIPSMTPELSFSVSITTPLAFAVQPNGTVDIVDAGNGLTFSQYNNAGTLLNQVPRIQPYGASYYTGAIDKANSAFYVSYKNSVIQETGDFSFKVLYYVGAIAKYNFTGLAQNTFDLPGRTTISTTCYTPSLMTVDAQSTLWIADQVCDQVLAYNSAGTQTQDFPLAYTAYPRGLWPAPSGNVFVAESVCDQSACPHLVTGEFSSAGAQQTSFAANSQLGEAWDARTVYMASPAGSTLQRFILDAAPTAPVPAGPQGALSQHSAMATLSWQAANDSDGDALLYSVYAGTSSSQLAFAGSTTQTSFVTQALSFGVNYFWQVTAQDSYMSLPMLISTGAIDGFTMSFQNSPPGAFAVATGTGTAVTRSTAATFGWTAAIDPDGDPVTYTATWQAAGQSTSTVVTTAANSITVNGLAFGAPVSWSVKACDPYAACTSMSGGTQSYEPVFENLPPPAPAVTGGTGVVSEHTLTPSANLSWSASIDPDGDLVGYRLSIGTNPASLALAQDGQQTGYALGGMTFGTTYYWQASAYDPYGGVGTTPMQSIVAQLQNSPPQPFAVLSGSGTLVTRAASQLLSWAAAVDPDGDTVVYELDLSTNPAALAAVQTSTATSFNLSFQFGAPYYWQVTARDGFGGATSSGLQVFSPIFQNVPPPAPSILQSTGTLSEHALTAQIPLSWSAVQDSESDPTDYALYIGTSPAALSQVQSSTQTSFSIANAGFGLTYYWEVAAQNPYGGTSTTTLQAVTPIFQNNPPGAFTAALGTGTLISRATTQILAWTGSVDPDGDPVSYALALSTNPARMSVVQASTATSYALAFAFGTTYYWTVSAFDGLGGTTAITGGTQSFLPTFLDQAPQAVQLAPQPVIATMRDSAAVSWQAVTNAEGDPVSYTVYLGDSAGDLKPFAEIAPSAAGGAAAQSVRVMDTTPQAQSQITGSTITLALTGLSYYRAYFMRIQAADPYGGTSMSPVQTFTLGSMSGFPAAYNYPNPFNPLRGGTNIVFNAPPSGYAKATVEVYSEWQDLLFRQDYFNIPAGVSQVPFAGRDRYGRPFFNGSYICRVRFAGPDSQTIFYLLVVK